MRKFILLLILATYYSSHIYLVAMRVQETSVEPIKIGVFIQETGPLSAWTPWLKQGFELGLDYATDNTRSTTGGRAYEIHYYDTSGDSTTILSLAISAIENDSVDILVGGISSPVAATIMEVAKNYDKLYLVGPASDPELTGSLFDSHTFRISSNADHESIASVYYSMDVLGAQKIAILALDHAYGYARANLIIQEVQQRGGNVVFQEYAPFATTDFSPHFTNLLNYENTNRLDMVYLIWAGDYTSLIRDLNAFDIQSRMNVSGSIYDILSLNSFEGILNTYGTTMEGLQGATTYGYDLPSNLVNDWMVKAHVDRNIRPNALYGQDYRVPEKLTAEAFGTAQFLANVANAVPDLNITSMIAHLEGLTLRTPKSFTYLRPEDHQGLAEMYYAEIWNDTRSASETYNLIIPKLVYTIPSTVFGAPDQESSSTSSIDLADSTSSSLSQAPQISSFLSIPLIILVLSSYSIFSQFRKRREIK